MTRNKPVLQLFTGSPLFCREEEWKPKESELRLSLSEVAASVSLTAAVFSANSVRTSSEQTKTKIKISFIVLKGSTQLAYVPLRGITARLQCCLEQVVMSQFRLHIYYILVIVRVKQCGSLYFGTYTSTEITRQKSLLIHFRDLVHCRKDKVWKAGWTGHLADNCESSRTIPYFSRPLSSTEALTGYIPINIQIIKT